MSRDRPENGDEWKAYCERLPLMTSAELAHELSQIDWDTEPDSGGPSLYGYLSYPQVLVDESVRRLRAPGQRVRPREAILERLRAAEAQKDRCDYEAQERTEQSGSQEFRARSMRAEARVAELRWVLGEDTSKPWSSI